MSLNSTSKYPILPVRIKCYRIGNLIDSVSISGEKMILLDTPSGYRAKIADARAGEMEVVTVYYTDANKKEHSNVFQITPSADQSLTVIQLDEAGRRIGSHHWVH